MLSLKEHNDTVDKLLKQITGKDTQISSLRKQLSLPLPIPKTENTEMEKKAARLQKEHRERIACLTQSLQTKTSQINDLKEQITSMRNLQVKQKDHVSELMRRNYADRKASSPFDLKIAALISHYEQQLAQKDKQIQSLVKEVKQGRQGREGMEGIQKRDQGQGQTESSLPRKINLLEHEQKIGKVKNEVARLTKLLEEKTKEAKDLGRKYSQLTNDYYRLINDAQPKSKQANILHQIGNQEEERDAHIELDGQSCSSASSASIHEAESQANQPCATCISHEDIFSELSQLLGKGDILHSLRKLKARAADLPLLQNIARNVQSLMYRFGMGKVSRSDVLPVLEQYETVATAKMQASDLLDQLCIEVGAKKDHLKGKVAELKCVQEQYLRAMRSIQIVKQLPKGNKLMEFITFFQLDEQDITLPEQLKNIHAQLKYVGKFIKQANVILGCQESYGLQNSLENVLRFIERHVSE